MSEASGSLGVEEAQIVLCPTTGLVMTSREQNFVYDFGDIEIKTSLTVLFTYCEDDPLYPSVAIFPNTYHTHLTLPETELTSNFQIVIIEIHFDYTDIPERPNIPLHKIFELEWQRTVLEWRRFNPEEPLAKTLFVPLLIDSLEKSLKPISMVVDFRETELIPANGDAAENSVEIKRQKSYRNKKSSSKVLTYSSFLNIIGEDKINNVALGRLTLDEATNYLKKILHFYHEGKPTVRLPRRESEEIRKKKSLRFLDIQHVEIICLNTLNKNDEAEATEIELRSNEEEEKNIETSNEVNNEELSSQETCFETAAERADGNENIEQLSENYITLIPETVVNLPTDTSATENLDDILEEIERASEENPEEEKSKGAKKKRRPRRKRKNDKTATLNKSSKVATSTVPLKWNDILEEIEDPLIALTEKAKDAKKKRKKKKGETKSISEKSENDIITVDDTVKYLLSNHKFDKDTMVKIFTEECELQLDTDEEYTNQNDDDKATYTTAQLEKILSDIDEVD